MSPPDYAEIARSIHARNCTPAAIETALRAAYARGKADAVSPGDVGVLVRSRVERHAARLDALSSEIEGLVRDLRDGGAE